MAGDPEIARCSSDSRGVRHLEPVARMRRDHQLAESAGRIGRQRGFEDEAAAGEGMVERKPRRVQELAGHLGMALPPGVAPGADVADVERGEFEVPGRPLLVGGRFAERARGALGLGFGPREVEIGRAERDRDHLLAGRVPARPPRFEGGGSGRGRGENRLRGEGRRNCAGAGVRTSGSR